MRWIFLTSQVDILFESKSGLVFRIKLDWISCIFKHFWCRKSLVIWHSNSQPRPNRNANNKSYEKFVCNIRKYFGQVVLKAHLANQIGFVKSLSPPVTSFDDNLRAFWRAFHWNKKKVISKNGSSWFVISDKSFPMNSSCSHVMRKVKKIVSRMLNRKKHCDNLMGLM